jgi:hypothetical protein
MSVVLPDTAADEGAVWLPEQPATRPAAAIASAIPVILGAILLLIGINPPY